MSTKGRVLQLIVACAVAGQAAAAGYTATDLGSGGGWSRYGISSSVVGFGKGFVGLNLSGHGLGRSNTGATAYLSDFGYMSAQASAVSTTHLAGRLQTMQRMQVKYFNAAYWDRVDSAPRDLDPQGWFLLSEALGIDVKNVVGYGMDSWGVQHATFWPNAKPIWNGAGYVDLSPDPATYDTSCAYGVSGIYQVGCAYDLNLFSTRAILWSGTAASAVDITPPNAGEAVAYGIGGNKVVGYFTIPGTGKSQAALWALPNYIPRNLTPAGYDSACAVAAKGGYQAGWGTLGGGHRALVWKGTAKTFFDLQTTLPAGFVSSEATSVYSDGSVGGYAIDVTGVSHAILWTPVI